MQRVTAVACVVLLASAPAVAQSRTTTGDISGVVLDASGAALPGTVITGVNTDTKLTRTTSSDVSGHFTLPALPPGAYNIRIDRSGFAPYVAPDVVVVLASTVFLQITLALAGVTETVTVESGVPLLDTRKTEVASAIGGAQLMHLPANGRNFIAFATMATGVAPDRTPQQGASATSGLTFAGQRARSNSILVDGLDNNDATVGAVRATFSQDAVREFQVLTHSFSAEFGKASGGVVNIITKSGTNTPTGSAFLLLRDRSLNARGAFDGPVEAPYSQEQFGATYGGPLRANRRFLFASFERQSIDATNAVTIDDKTQVYHPITTATLGTPLEILARAGAPVETGNVPYRVTSTQLLARLDFHLNDTQALAVRMNAAEGRNENTEPFGGLVARSRAAALDHTDASLALVHSLVSRNRLVQELRFQLAYRDQQVLATDPSCNGICEREDEGGPALDVTGVASVGRHRFTPQPRRNIRYQLLESVSYQASAHLLKVGIDYNYVNDHQSNLPLNFGGRYVFSALPPIPGLLPVSIDASQALALGLPAAYVQGYGLSAAPHDYSDVSLFVQDEWRSSPRLTLRFGARYQNQFWSDLRFTVPGYPGSYRLPRDNNNVAPRAAIAWDPTGTAKTTVHASYGVFHDNHITGIQTISDALDGREGVRNLVLRFPATLAAWNTPTRRLPEPALPYPSLVATLDPGLQTPFAHQASVGIDRLIGPGWIASGNFLYSRGFHQLGTIDYNPLVRDLGSGRRPEDVVGIPGTSASILQLTSFGETWYRGVALTLRRRFADGHQLMGGYTLSKAEDTSTDFQGFFPPQAQGRGRNPADPNGLPVDFNPRLERGLSLQDQGHRFVTSGILMLPAGLVGSAVVTIGSGRPYNILAGTDLNGDGDAGAPPVDRPRRVLADESTSVGRNAGEMPWQATLDVRISQRIPVAGRLRLEWLVEAFNLFNRTNFSEANPVFGTGIYPTQPLATFGVFEQAGPPRQAQIGIRAGF